MEEPTKAKFLQVVHPEKRAEWNSTPTLEVADVAVSFLHHFHSTTIICNVYTTVVAAKAQYRFLLVIRDQKSGEILMKIDVGNVQVVGNKVRVFSRTSMAVAADLMAEMHDDSQRRKLLMEQNLPGSSSQNTVK